MVEVQGNSVRLYLEGLMFLAFDKKEYCLEAGILNVDDGHNLRIRTFSRNPTMTSATSDEIWDTGEAESIPDSELRLYDRGEITALRHGNKAKRITSALVPENIEMWMPLNLIPEFEDIVGCRVKLDRSKVRPVISIPGGNFFSVLQPDHVEDAKPPQKQARTRGFIQTYRLGKEVVSNPKIESCGEFKSLHDLLNSGVAHKNLAIRAYTAATMITLNEDEELIGILKRGRAEQRMIFRVKYDPNREAKVVIENAVTQHDDNTLVHSHVDMDKSDPSHFFHFLHFYDAIRNVDEEKQYVLVDSDMLDEFFNMDAKAKPEAASEADPEPDPGNPTGGNHPTCPAVLMSSGLFND